MQFEHIKTGEFVKQSIYSIHLLRQFVKENLFNFQKVYKKEQNMVSGGKICHLVCECAEVAALPLAREDEEHIFCGVSRIDINKESAALAGRDEGRYVSISFGALPSLDRDALEEITSVAAKELSALGARCFDRSGYPRVLVVGLGNRRITHDSLGALTCDALACGENLFVFEVGVAGKSGIDSVRVVRGIAECCEADIVIAVDSLAARSEVRVGRVLQLSESGIAPASGVRKGSAFVDRASVGAPVIAIGIPTALSEDGGDERGYLSVGEDLLEICEVGAFVVSEMIKNAFKPKEE